MSERTDFEAGKQAYNEGKTIDDCDRKPWTVAYDDWVEGYHAAQWDADHAEAVAEQKRKSEQNLGTAAYVFLRELEEWKLAKFSFDNVLAIRSCGRMVKHGSEDGARDAIRREAARALLDCYHREGSRAAIAKATGAGA